eukprot:2556165-Pyramimonas_sp.AAC.1
MDSSVHIRKWSCTRGPLGHLLGPLGALVGLAEGRLEALYRGPLGALPGPSRAFQCDPEGFKRAQD